MREEGGEGRGEVREEAMALVIEHWHRARGFVESKVQIYLWLLCAMSRVMCVCVCVFVRKCVHVCMSVCVVVWAHSKVSVLAIKKQIVYTVWCIYNAENHHLCVWVCVWVWV